MRGMPEDAEHLPQDPVDVNAVFAIAYYAVAGHTQDLAEDWRDVRDCPDSPPCAPSGCACWGDALAGVYPAG